MKIWKYLKEAFEDNLSRGLKPWAWAAAITLFLVSLDYYFELMSDGFRNFLRTWCLICSLFMIISLVTGRYDVDED